ncbi:conjugative transposon protein TraM [Pedobacter frigidisoli]|uniref:Conjugative transposon protein TraM n=1 Tax=Pedobacter frigidisoli TaxID=2530455 RepID=A0A4R0NZS3_9SPHI|nr:conjugative transposon protein TraM [Pedobacter frigidisoli]TCD07695.1 conjugative transposon protein TraM [Pedobacter frigidisoli]
MKKINLNRPRYVLPILSLPFILILFYVYTQSAGKSPAPEISGDQINPDIAKVSTDISEKGLVDKLEAYRERYRQGDGYTAIGTVQEADQAIQKGSSGYNQAEKRMLDSIEYALKSAGSPARSFSQPARQLQTPQLRASPSQKILARDRALASALNAIDQQQRGIERERPRPPQADPMSLFRAQMALVDSMGKANDPDYQSRIRKSEREKPGLKVTETSILPVYPLSLTHHPDNTIFAERLTQAHIPAIIDEPLTAFSGSRIRIRVLSDLLVGRIQVKKNTELYGIISGFSAQRVFISVSSLGYQGELLPVRLEVYDLDGIKGIYVPASAFRELTRELGSNSTQGLSLESSGEENKQLMSIMGRMFQSTSAALNRMMRQNKAKISYATHVLLIDPEQLQKRQAKP